MVVQLKLEDFVEKYSGKDIPPVVLAELAVLQGEEWAVFRTRANIAIEAVESFLDELRRLDFDLS